MIVYICAKGQWPVLFGEEGTGKTSQRKWYLREGLRKNRYPTGRRDTKGMPGQREVWMIQQGLLVSLWQHEPIVLPLTWGCCEAPPPLPGIWSWHTSSAVQSHCHITVFYPLLGILVFYDMFLFHILFLYLPDCTLATFPTNLYIWWEKEPSWSCSCLCFHAWNMLAKWEVSRNTYWMTKQIFIRSLLWARHWGYGPCPKVLTVKRSKAVHMQSKCIIILKSNKFNKENKSNRTE